MALPTITIKNVEAGCIEMYRHKDSSGQLVPAFFSDELNAIARVVEDHIKSESGLKLQHVKFVNPRILPIDSGTIIKVPAIVDGKLTSKDTELHEVSRGAMVSTRGRFDITIAYNVIQKEQENLCNCTIDSIIVCSPAPRLIGHEFEDLEYKQYGITDEEYKNFIKTY